MHGRSSSRELQPSTARQTYSEEPLGSAHDDIPGFEQHFKQISCCAFHLRPLVRLDPFTYDNEQTVRSPLPVIITLLEFGPTLFDCLEHRLSWELSSEPFCEWMKMARSKWRIVLTPTERKKRDHVGTRPEVGVRFQELIQ